MLLIIKTEVGIEYNQLQAIFAQYSSAIKNKIYLSENNNMQLNNHEIIILDILDTNIIKYLKNDILQVKNIKLSIIEI